MGVARIVPAVVLPKARNGHPLAASRLKHAHQEAPEPGCLLLGWLHWDGCAADRVTRCPQLLVDPELQLASGKVRTLHLGAAPVRRRLGRTGETSRSCEPAHIHTLCAPNKHRSNSEKEFYDPAPSHNTGQRRHHP